VHLACSLMRYITCSRLVDASNTELKEEGREVGSRIKMAQMASNGDLA
jgi:hypothetical protein